MDFFFLGLNYGDIMCVLLVHLVRVAYRHALAPVPVLLHPNEPTGPSVKTAIPGPKSIKLIKELSEIQVPFRFYEKNLQ